MYLSILLSVLLLTYGSVFADGGDIKCPHLPIVLKQLNLSPSDCYEDLAIEKVLPYSKSQSVLVIPKLVQQGEDGLDLDAYILIINNQTGKIEHRYYEALAWTSDALQLEEILIDTAPYGVSRNKRAFGIRVKYEGSSKPNPYSEETLSLFITQGDKLIKVLDNFVMASFSGEWDMNCQGTFQQETKILQISTHPTNEFYDLAIKNRITKIERTAKGDECEEATKQATHSLTLHYKGGRYQ